MEATPPDPPRLHVSHDARRGCFEALVEGQPAGELSYRLDAGCMVMHHTGVDPARQGQGIAAALVRTALDHARQAGLKVRPHCSYVAAYLRRHPEDRDLVV